MEYIITESQLGLLCENKLSLFQSLVDNSLRGIKSDSEFIDADTFPDDLSFNSCDECNWVEEIIIKEFSWELSLGSKSFKEGTPLLILKVDIESSSVVYFEPYTLMFDVSKRISDLLGTAVRIDIEHVDNREVEPRF